MRFRSLVVGTMLCALISAGGAALAPARAQTGAQAQSRSGGSSSSTPYQRLEVLRQQLDTLRRSFSSAIVNLGGDPTAKDNKKNQKDQPAQAGAPDDSAASDAIARLRGLDKEAGSLMSELLDIRGKVDRSERYDVAQIEKLESAVADFNTRAETALRETAGLRRNTPASETAVTKVTPEKRDKKNGGFFSHLIPFGHGSSGDKEIDELTGTIAPGRDRELFAAGTRRARKGDYEGSRLLFGVIINTYPDSPFLPYAKLAMADTFYLDGTTSALIQAGAAYQEWLTFFPTDPLAERVMLKMAEVEMRQMGLPDRSIEHARKAEQRLKAALQQFPQTSLRPEFEERLRETQENLAMHDYGVGVFYEERYLRHLATNPKGAQSRYRDIIDRYPNFSRRAEVLYRLGQTYQWEEEPDEAAKVLQELVRMHPNSEYTEKAKEQLQAIGADVPATDPHAVQDEPDKPTFMEKVKHEALGMVDVTVDKDGVLISRDSKATADPIDKVLANGGQLPVSELNGPTPSARVSLAPRPAVQTTTPAQPTGSGGVKITPTQTGQPATGSDPTRPSPPPPGQQQ